MMQLRLWPLNLGPASSIESLPFSLSVYYSPIPRSRLLCGRPLMISIPMSTAATYLEIRAIAVPLVDGEGDQAPPVPFPFQTITRSHILPCITPTRSGPQKLWKSITGTTPPHEPI
jgi:hypothetical protein